MSYRDRMRSLAAGILIGLGFISNILVQNNILGACLFSLGLLAIIHMQLSLFTGRVGFGVNKGNFEELLEILFYNSIGAFIIVAIGYLSNPLLIEKVTEVIIEDIIPLSFTSMLFKGILCGILIHTAVKIKNDIITILCIMTFILIGAQHCIAFIPYIWASIPLDFFNVFMKWIFVIIGNMCGALLIEECFEGRA